LHIGSVLYKAHAILQHDTEISPAAEKSQVKLSLKWRKWACDFNDDERASIQDSAKRRLVHMLRLRIRPLCTLHNL